MDSLHFVAADPDVEFRIIYVDKTIADPSDVDGRSEWKQKAKLATILLSQSIRKHESVSVLFDRMPPPPYGTFEQVVLGRLAVDSAFSPSRR